MQRNVVCVILNATNENTQERIINKETPLIWDWDNLFRLSADKLLQSAHFLGTSCTPRLPQGVAVSSWACRSKPPQRTPKAPPMSLPPSLQHPTAWVWHWTAINAMFCCYRIMLHASDLIVTEMKWTDLNCHWYDMTTYDDNDTDAYNKLWLYTRLGKFPLGLVHQKRPPQVPKKQCFPCIL